METVSPLCLKSYKEENEGTNLKSPLPYGRGLIDNEKWHCSRSSSLYIKRIFPVAARLKFLFVCVNICCVILNM